MIKLMEEASTFIWMVLNIKEIGGKTNNMDMELKHGQMEQGMMGIMNMVKSTEQAHSNGLTIHNTLESSITITSMVKEYIHGQMGESTKESGETIKCMAKEHSHGQMVGSM